MQQSRTTANEQSSSQALTASTPDMLTLLEFQQKFIQAVHSELYNKQPMDEDAIVRFEIAYLSEMNDAWKRMVEDLVFRLVKQREEYETPLRDTFHKVLNVDFLVFLRINRHDLTQIINRIDGHHHLAVKNQPPPSANPQYHNKPRDIWQALKQGWTSFLYQSTLHKISLNIYMLKQYLKVAAKSLTRKDKEIVFTGCCGLFGYLVPVLKANREIWLLVELAELNNQLYNFHQNFTYSHFYSLMLPLQTEYQPVFRPLKAIAQKCLNAKLLTPLLFGLLRHRQQFHQFIEQTDDPCWTPYLNGIVYAIIHNFKIRILQYEQVIQILMAAILKLGVFGALDVAYFGGEVEKEWGEARDFFIAALKIGGNVGELAMWHGLESNNIQQRIINCSKDSLLMHKQLPANTPTKIYFPQGYQPQLQQCLHQITGNLLPLKHLTTSFSPNIAQAVEINQYIIYSILRLASLIRLCRLMDNTHCICYVLSFLNRVGRVQSVVVGKRLAEIGEGFWGAGVAKVDRQEKGCQALKQVLFTYIKTHKPISKLPQTIKTLLQISNPKEATTQILSILQSNPEAGPSLPQLVAANIIAFYTQQKLQATTTVKTFEKEYVIEQEVVNLNNRMHTCVGVLVEAVVERGCGIAMDVLLWIGRLCNWMVIPLLTFPTTPRYNKLDNPTELPNPSTKKLQSFGIWLIANPTKYDILLELLSIGMNIGNSRIRTFFVEISLVTVCDQIVMEVNRVLGELEDLEDCDRYRYIIKLLQFFIILYPSTLTQNSSQPQTHTQTQTLKKLLKLYFHSLLKLDTTLLNNPTQQLTLQLIASIFELYCPLLDLIFQSGELCRSWRTYMRKICLTSLDGGYGHGQTWSVRDFEISSMRKDKGFIVYNSVEFNKDGGLVQGASQVKARVQSLMNEAKKYQKPNVFKLSYQSYLQKQYQISYQQIQNFQLSPTPTFPTFPSSIPSTFTSTYSSRTSSPSPKKPTTPTPFLSPNSQIQQKDLHLFTKEFLLPSLSLKMISQLFSNCSANSRMLIADLLAMTPGNHKKIVQWAVINADKDILGKVGISRLVVQGGLCRIIKILDKQQMQILIQNLDTPSKTSLSDTLNLILLSQSPQCPPPAQLLPKLSTSLSFLLTYNQSNWRYLNQMIGQLALTRNSGLGLGNIPSVLLQYLEYVRITGRDNSDYEEKLKLYEQIIGAYARVLEERVSIGMDIDGDEIGSIEEIRLYKINQLSYIRSFCQSYNIKDFLTRSQTLQSQLPTPLPTTCTLLSTITTHILSLTKTANSIIGGFVLCPDFLHSYCMVSESVYLDCKICVGEWLEMYYRASGKEPRDVYCYRELKVSGGVGEFLGRNFTGGGSGSGLGLGEILTGLCLDIRNKNDSNLKRIIKQKYQILQKYLLSKKVITIQNSTLCLCNQQATSSEPHPEDPSPQKCLFYLGILYSSLQKTSQATPSLSPLLQQCLARNPLPWQLLKPLDSQAYHHIKSILVDQQIQSRKFKFIYKEKLLLPQGASLEINRFNRERYCNLVGKAVLGDGLFGRVTAFLQGFWVLV